MKRLLLIAAIITSLAGLTAGDVLAADNIAPDALPGEFSSEIGESGALIEHDLIETELEHAVEGLTVAHHDSEADHGSGGLPQLDPTWFASQIFWLVFIFTALYLLFSRSVLPTLSNTLENRHEHIQGDLDTAQRLKSEAEKVHEDYETGLEKARSKATKLYRDVEDDIKVKSEKQQDELRDRLQKETELSEARIERSKNEAMKNMNAIAAEIAAEAAKKLVGITTDLNSARSVVEALNNNKANKKAA